MLPRSILLIVCLFISLSPDIFAARILGIFPFRSFSHYAVAKRIMRTLATRGHQVTVVSGVREKPLKNFKHIYLGDKLPSFEDAIDMSTDTAPDLIGLLNQIDQLESYMCETILSDGRLKNITDDLAYDLLFVECYTVPCFLGLAVQLNVPVIWYAASGTAKAHDYLTGNIISPAISGSLVNGVVGNPTFMQRLRLFYEHTIMLAHHLAMEYKMTDIFNRLNNKSISKGDMQRKANLIFSCQHEALFPRPNVPSIIPIAGLHIEDVKPLPEDIRKFMDEATHGVILVSFGTALKLSTFKKEKLNIFLETFARIPQRILWRGDITNITNLPANVMLRYWFPQSDVLAHKNIRAFISHGGIHGIYEAIHNAVPIIGMPFLYDQLANIRSLEDKRVAIYIDYKILSTDLLINAIDEILNNTGYRNRMNLLSAVFRDRPMSPLDTAVYWTEYVIRHNGADHMRSPAADMPLYQLLLLDVSAFILTSIGLCLYVLYFVIRKTIALFKMKIPSKMKIS